MLICVVHVLTATEYPHKLKVVIILLSCTIRLVQHLAAVSLWGASFGLESRLVHHAVENVIQSGTNKGQKTAEVSELLSSM